ncbi:MAG: dihydrolipoyl dehydrogenase [Pyramidobacter sp.]|nr:dihydrolipoyl dehydrogenase [Pyramidobacter sp.]
MDYEEIVIGGGPGGYLAAERAGQAGLSTLLIENAHVGGTCLNEGCIPTKTLLRSAKLYKSCLEGSAYGVSCKDVKIDHRFVVERKRKVTSNLISGVTASLRAAKVKTINGTAIIKGRNSDGIVVSVGDKDFSCRNLIIASGSSPIIPNIQGLDKAMESGFVMTSTGILELDSVPETLCIIGGGVIGLEMATYFAMIGSKVHVIEAADKIAGALDKDIAAVIQKGCQDLGIDIHVDTKAVAFEDGTVTVSKDGSETTVSCDKVLLCIGRKANVQNIGLESLGIPYSVNGIKVDEYCLTGVPNVYAVGDCTGQNMQAHVAYRQAEVAIGAILGKNDPMRWACVPGLVHTEPEAAFVGLSDAEAKEAGIDTVVSKLSMNFSGLYLAENEGGTGIIKLVFDRKKKTLIGAQIAGGPASDLITICGMMIENQLPVDRMKEYVFPHPTNAEAIREAIFAAKL